MSKGEGAPRQVAERVHRPTCFLPLDSSSFASRKRTLLFGEYMNGRLMLLLPHRQVVFTFPKVLRVFFRYDRGFFGQLCQLVCS